MKIYNAYLKRITMSPLLYVSILGVFAICCFGMSSQSGHPGGVIFMYDVMLDISSYRKLIMLFATLPFGTVYCREWNEKNANYIICRSSVARHLSAYILFQFITAFLVAFMGIILSVAVFCINGKLFISNPNPYTDTFGQLMNENDVLLYLFFRSYHYSFSIAVWALAGTAMSSIFLNPYIAICSPLVFSYVLEMITIENSFLPDLWHLSLSYTEVSDNPFIASAFITIIFSVLGAVFAAVFWNQAKRRVQNVIS